MGTLFDFAPTARPTSGIDRVFDLLESAAQRQGDNYPAYDWVRLGEHRFRLTLAVPGFAQGEVAVTVRKGELVISGDRRADGVGEYLHRGIPSRVFSRRFQLADHVEVTGATLSNGLLSVELAREIPEAEKPRSIPVGGTPERHEPARQIEREAT